MKFEFFHKISIIQDKFLVFLNLLRGPDITRSGAGSGPRAVHPWDRERTNWQHRIVVQERDL